MAAIGEVASILTITQSAKQLYDFRKSIEDAPTYILDIVDDARVLRTIVEQIEYDEDASQTQLVSAVDVLALCKLKMQKIELLFEDLGLQTCSKRRRTWGSIKAVLHKEKIEALRKSLESAKSTLAMARGVFAEQATKRRDMALLTTGMNNFRVQQTTHESVTMVTEHMERFQENLAYQQNSINTVIASQRDIEQHVTKIHLDVDQAVQRSCPTSESLAQPMIRSLVKHSITGIVHEALHDHSMRKELSRIMSSMSTSSNDSRERLKQPSSTTAATTSSLACYGRSQPASPRKRYTKKSTWGDYKMYNSIVGTVHYITKIVHRQSYDVSESSTWHELETTFRIIPAPWLMRFSFEFVSTKTFDARSHNLRTFGTVPDNALIFEFCQKGNVAGIRSLIQRGLASPFDRDVGGWTPLHYAVLNGGYDVFAMLIQAGAPVDARAYNYEVTPLILFSSLHKTLSDATLSETERIAITRLFLEEGETDVTLTGSGGQTIFHCPCVPLEWLLHNEGLLFNPLQVNQYGKTALMTACDSFLRGPKDLKMLIEAGSDVSARDACGRDALYLCLDTPRGNAPQSANLRVLLQAGAVYQTRLMWRDRTLTSLALREPQRLRCWRDALLSLEGFDLIKFLSAELENGMPLREDGWTIHSLCGIFLAPSAALARLDGIIRLEKENFLKEESRRQWGTENIEEKKYLDPEFHWQLDGEEGPFWEQWKQINSWTPYLDDVKERMRDECYLPHLGIIPKRKIRFVSQKRGCLTLRKVWNRTLRQKHWNAYRSLPGSLREYRVCTLPSVAGSWAPL